MKGSATKETTMNMDAMLAAKKAQHPDRIAADGSMHWCADAANLHNDILAWHDAGKPAAAHAALEARRLALQAARP
jgi:hypothetical protein